MNNTVRALALVAGLLIAHRSAADPAPHVAIRLTFAHPPAVCPEADLRIEFARRLGYDPFAADAPGRLDVSIVRIGRALAATVVRYDARGARVGAASYPGAADRCGDLLSAIGSAWSFDIDPYANMPAAPPLAAPGPSPPVVLLAPPPPPPPTVRDLGRLL